jgi:phage terminase large subunit
VEVQIDTTISFEHLLEAKSRVTQHIGGTRSGKSYGILQWIIVEAIQKQLTVTIVRKTIPSLKRTIIKDFKDILTRLNLWSDERFNITDRVYKLYDSSIQFVSVDDADKLRGIKSDILFIDEASEIDEESYFQLSIRTTNRIILAYNPTISPYHWLRQMQDCDRFVTTYRDNPYLEKEIVSAIEELEIKNPKYWKIYGKGEFAPNDKAVFTFDVVDDWNEDVDNFNAEFVAFGMDFGFSNDPTTLCAVYKRNDEVYVEELMYDKGLVTKDIADKLKSLDITKSEEIWCDSAEPRLVEELYRSGFNAKPVKKGPDSIKFGIGVLQNYNIHINKKSQNLINEMYAYQYQTDKHGYTTDIPEGGLDHLIDALRYVAMMKLSQKAVAKGKYAITIGKYQY